MQTLDSLRDSGCATIERLRTRGAWDLAENDSVNSEVKLSTRMDGYTNVERTCFMIGHDVGMEGQQTVFPMVVSPAKIWDKISSTH